MARLHTFSEETIGSVLLGRQVPGSRNAALCLQHAGQVGKMAAVSGSCR